MIDLLRSSDFVWRLGWTLLHSLWQILAVSVIASFVLAILSRHSANTRYWVACSSLALFFAPMVATFVLIPSMPTSEAEVVAAPEEETNPSSREVNPAPETHTLAPTLPSLPKENPNSEVAIVSVPSDLPQDSEQVVSSNSDAPSAEVGFAWLHWIVGGWGIMVVLISLSNLGGWVVVQRLTKTASLPATEFAANRLKVLAEQMGITQSVRLFETLQIDSPLVIGWLRPVVLLPVSLITTLTPAELDAVLSHELAHIRRYDYLVNLLQTFCETLLFFHPAVWWLSRRIRIEREYCCDDEAISVCGDKTSYARALAAVEASRQTPRLAMPFFGRNKNMTLYRVRRIMGLRVDAPNAWLNVGSILLLMVVAISAFVLSQSEGNAARETDKEWGESVEGTQARLRVDKMQWQSGEIIPFHFDIRNHGKRELLVTQAQQPCEIEFDGKWYSWSGAYSLKASPLSPGKQHENIRVSLVEHWKSDDGDSLPLTVGKHSVRVAIPARSPNPKSPEPLPPIRAISNAVEIEILAGDKHARFEWGEERDGLKTRLTSKTQAVRAGYSVLLTLEVKNVSETPKKYQQTPSRFSDEFEVLDESGKPVPHLVGPIQVIEQRTEIQPGETQIIDSFDLADSYFLREPGAYSVQLLSDSLPPSGVLNFEITTDRAAMNDPIVPLLRLTKKNWFIVASPGAHVRMPGAKWMPTNCRMVTFRLDPPRSISDYDSVQLFLADEAAKVVPPTLDIDSSAPDTEYLGKISRWHVYYLASAGALKAWPTAKDDITKALQTVPVPSAGGQQRQAYDPITAHVDRLNTGPGKWKRGIHPVILLHEYASHKQLLNQAITKHRFDDGDITSYRILETRKLEFESEMTGYFASLIDTNIGPKIFMFKYEGEQRWWTRFYEIVGKQSATEPVRREQSSSEKTGVREIDELGLDKLVAEADLIAEVEVISEPSTATDENFANHLCKVDFRQVFKNNLSVQSLLGVNIVQRKGKTPASTVPVEKGAKGILFLKRHPVVINPPYITTDIHTGILKSSPTIQKAILERLERQTKEKIPFGIRPREGVFVRLGTNSSTVLELKDGKFRYWFDSAAKLEPRKYPLLGEYTVEDHTITLHHDLILDSQNFWTFHKHDDEISAWNLDAFEFYRTEGKLSKHGILKHTTQTAEEAYKSFSAVEKGESKSETEGVPDVSASIDLNSFRLDFEYQGPSDKPFYDACLHTGEIDEKLRPSLIIEPLSEFRATRVLAWLKRSRFFEHAGAKPVKPQLQRYVLRVTSAGKVYEEDLGWDLPMLLRIDSLSRVFDEQPEGSLRAVQAPSPLNRLVSRLGGERLAWLNGKTVDDLKYRLVSNHKTFVKAGEPIKITLDVTNTGGQTRKYSNSSVSFDDFHIKVFDEFGRTATYVGGPSQQPFSEATLGPGKTAVIESFDITDFRYMRQPGMYTIAYFGGGQSRSNHIAVHVTPNSVDDGNLVGRLLPLVHDNWVLIANPNFKGQVRPGNNFEEVSGQEIVFLNSPTGSKRDTSMISLWFTNEKAKPRVPKADETHPSTYVGKVNRWFLYAHIDESGSKRWPGILKDVQRALGDRISS